MRDGLVVFTPLIGFGDGLSFSRAECIAIFDVLIVNHDFEQMNDSSEFAGVELTVGVKGTDDNIDPNSPSKQIPPPPSATVPALSDASGLSEPSSLMGIPFRSNPYVN